MFNTIWICVSKTWINKKISRNFFWMIWLMYAVVCMTKNCYSGAMAAIVSDIADADGIDIPLRIDGDEDTRGLRHPGYGVIAILGRLTVHGSGKSAAYGSIVHPAV